MPPKSQQPRDKDGKFLPKSGQPPSSLATPSAQPSSSKRAAREASPARARSTSRSRSKRPAETPLNPQSSSNSAPEKQAESSTSAPEQSRQVENLLDLLSDSEDSQSEPDLENPLDPNTSTASAPTLARLHTNLMRQNNNTASQSPNRGMDASSSPLHIFPPHRTSAPTRPSSPMGNRRAHFTSSFFPSTPAAGPTHNGPSGIAAMPAPKSKNAPHFSGEDDDILSEFLQEYCQVLACELGGARREL